MKNKSIKILKKFKNKWRKIYKILITNNIEEKVSKILQIYLRKKNVILVALLTIAIYRKYNN